MTASPPSSKLAGHWSVAAAVAAERAFATAHERPAGPSIGTSAGASPNAQTGVSGEVGVGDGSAERGRDKRKRSLLPAGGNRGTVRADEAMPEAVQVDAVEPLPLR